MKKCNPYIKIRHVILLYLQRVGKLSTTNGSIRLSVILMIKWKYIVQVWWLKDMLKGKELISMEYFLWWLDLPLSE